MGDQSISPDHTRPDPDNSNWTIPRTYGVWELKPGSDGARYRYGNNPVRGVELARDYGSATLIALYTTRLAAKSHADALN